MCLTTLKPQTSKNKSKKKMESAEKWKEILKEWARRQRRTSLLMKTNVSSLFISSFLFISISFSAAVVYFASCTLISRTIFHFYDSPLAYASMSSMSVKKQINSKRDPRLSFKRFPDNLPSKAPFLFIVGGTSSIKLRPSGPQADVCDERNRVSVRLF